MVLEIVYSFLILPMATSNWIQMSWFLSITYPASGTFSPWQLYPMVWTTGIWRISFWKAQIPLQFIKQIRHLKIIFSIFLCKPEFIIWGFPSFLEQSLKWYILVARTCESCQIASQQGQSWVRKQVPRWVGSCTSLWLSFTNPRLVLHKQGQILMPPTDKVHSFWSGCMCGIWSSVLPTNVQWSTLSSFYRIKKFCRWKSAGKFCHSGYLNFMKRKVYHHRKIFPFVSYS